MATPTPRKFSRPQAGAIDTRAIWAIALPAMVTNVATALIGIGDIWIVGRLEDAAAQGAVDVGARLFAVLFTVMNFLKTGTTGLVAQDGTRAATNGACMSSAEAQAATLVRGLAIGAAIATALLLLKPVLLPAMLDVLGADGAVLGAARAYADIRYWSAPGVMLNLALIGFLVGRRQMKAVLLFEVAYNFVNVVLGLWFVLALDFGIAGIGWSSFIAEYAKLFAVLLFVVGGTRGAPVLAALRRRSVLRWEKLAPFLSVNRDLFFRTLVLAVSLAALTRISADRGAVTLAANGIIYQLFVFSALLLDGFENAAQVLNGERLGAKDRKGFSAYTRAILLRGLSAAVIVAGVFALFGGPILASFAATDAVEATARNHAIWLVVIPFAGVASFVFDGVFVGASWTRALFGTMAGAAAVYALSLWLTWNWGNDGLWFSFTLFLGLRAILQATIMPRLLRQSFGA
ncbi:DNA-damage-inducible protein [Alteripontixanthobacter maritimus]|uniref:DNA-damage-inducible protein n=1 Tax=Alteripontixanthobacter maritimus TaxID=2161824 RepID=A0A369Q676_9SPHN|nr:MATE family efflux transporter [Alteripontixanthobacter maritimus]RDC60383.1 DNA-damage-inducible protein [Alteripontixanthobacter maritimus]